jgi:AcrR family transcriptional regulator
MRITKEPEIRRQEIIDQARILFETRGISKTSMTEIAQKVGVAKGLVYYYFSSKELLVNEVVEQFIWGLDDSLQCIIHQENLDFFGKLTAILALYFNSFKENPVLMKFSPADASVLNLLRDRMSAIAFGYAKELLQAGQQQNLVQIEYPEYTLKILISGLGDLYMEGVRDPRIHTTLIEQAIGLPKGRLSF